MSTTTEAPPGRQGTAGVRSRADRTFAGAALGAGLLILAVLAGVAVFLLIQAVPALTAPADEIPGGEGLSGYIAPLIFGTLLSSTIALLVATPLAVCVALFITHYAPRLADGRPDTFAHGLVNADDFLEVCADLPFGAILHGHVHRCFTVRVPRVRPTLFGAGSTTQDLREGLWLFDISPDGVRAVRGGRRVIFFGPA